MSLMINRYFTILFAAFLIRLPAAAQTTAPVADPAFVKEVALVAPKCVAWRRQLHQHPELSNRETNTAKLVAAHLRSFGIEVKEGVAHTGVVGLLKGGKPGPIIGLRADMDALPVTEDNNLSFASKVKTEYNNQEVGVMHACSHDTHVAMLMSVAEILSKYKAQLAGTVKFIFQPAEEGPPAGEEGGALLMIKEGVMDNPKVDVMFGLHISAQAPVGQIRYRAKGMMAAADWFHIDIKGKQSHGAQPWLGIDPVVVGAQIIGGLQTIVSRQMELTKNAVVISTTIFKGGVRENIIPEEASLAGTIRTLDTAMRSEIKRRIVATATNIAEASGATASVSFEAKTAVVYNDPQLLQQMLPSLQKAANGNIVEMDAVTGAEDYSYFAERVPSLFFYLGGRPLNISEKESAPHHTPKFYVDEAGMQTGILAFCQLVMDYPKVKR